MFFYRSQNTEVALQTFRIVVINVVFNHFADLRSGTVTLKATHGLLERTHFVIARALGT